MYTIREYPHVRMYICTYACIHTYVHMCINVSSYVHENSLRDFLSLWPGRHDTNEL